MLHILWIIHSSPISRIASSLWLGTSYLLTSSSASLACLFCHLPHTWRSNQPEAFAWARPFLCSTTVHTLFPIVEMCSFSSLHVNTQWTPNHFLKFSSNVISGKLSQTVLGSTMHFFRARCSYLYYCKFLFNIHVTHTYT